MTDAELLAEEQRKYRRMWGMDSYREVSPGLNIAPRVHDLLGLVPGMSLIDFGCGEGKAADWFRAQGLRVTALDLVPLRPDVLEACLWDLPALTADVGFSADVLEHIPEPKVPDVLANMRRCVSRAAFTVATVRCAHGRRVGEVLHQTVRPVHWWRKQMREHWARVEHHETDREWRHLFIVEDR